MASYTSVTNRGRAHLDTTTIVEASLSLRGTSGEKAGPLARRPRWHQGGRFMGFILSFEQGSFGLSPWACADESSGSGGQNTVKKLDAPPGRSRVAPTSIGERPFSQLVSFLKVRSARQH